MIAGSLGPKDAPSIMLSLALDPGRSGFRPAVIRVRITKSAIARNDQRDTLFQRSHAAIVPDVLPDVFYRAPGTFKISGLHRLPLPGNWSALSDSPKGT